MGKAELVGIGFLEGHELPAVLFFEVDSLESHEVQVGDQTRD